MRDLPIVARSVINIILFVIYWAITCLFIGIVANIVNGTLDAAMADKIAIFAAVFILLVSLILRKYFYILGYEEGTEVIIKESYTAKKKQPSKKTKKTISIEDDDDIKIYVDKEIK